MNSNLILKADILDILFERRNKAYGAYTLRKFYHQRIRKSVLFILGLAVFMFYISSLAPAVKNWDAKTYLADDVVLTNADIKPKENQLAKPKLPEKPQVKKDHSAGRKFISNFQIVANNLVTDTLHNLRDNDVIASINSNSLLSSIPVVAPVLSNSGGGSSEKTIVPAINKNTPFDADKVEVAPQYPGGMEALRRFLQRNMENPVDMEPGDVVSVKVKFVVGYDGKLRQFETVENGGDLFNKEVIRVLKKMPNWIPGRALGENVSVYYVVPVKFVGGN